MIKILATLALALSLHAGSNFAVTSKSIHHTLTENHSEYYNNYNWGLALEHTFDNGWGLHGIAYYNSYYLPTVGVGPHYEYEAGPVVLSAAVTFASGYEHLGVKYLPLPTVGVQYGYLRVITTLPFMAFTPYDSVTSLHFVIPINWED